MKFKIGDRVKRLNKTGTVTRCYSRGFKFFGSVFLGPYPELYDVKWDDGSTGNAYLPHGLVLEFVPDDLE